MSDTSTKISRGIVHEGRFDSAEVDGFVSYGDDQYEWSTGCLGRPTGSSAIFANEVP